MELFAFKRQKFTDYLFKEHYKSVLIRIIDIPVSVFVRSYLVTSPN